MKIFLLFLLIVSSVFTCLAQSTNSRGKFSMGIDVGFPLSDYDSYYMVNLYKYGIGGSLNFDIPTSVPNLYFTLSGGIIIFKASDEAAARINEVTFGRGAKSEDYAPLKIGVKYYFGKSFFGEAQVGSVIHTGPSVPFFSDNFQCLAYSPGIGYSFNNGIEVGARYEHWNTGGSMGKLTQLGIRAAYAVKLPSH